MKHPVFTKSTKGVYIMKHPVFTESTKGVV